MLRLPDLDLRPMHVDEAVQAGRFGQLIEEGTFDYLPEDGHGPGLLYLTLPFAKLAGVETYAETSEKLLRSVPAFFGLALIVLTAFAFRSWLGAPAAIASALLVAASPMMGFYSRYFIMEMPMVFLLLVFLICAWRYLLSRHLAWLIAAGVCGAFMHATKETFGISIVALVLAVGIVTVIQSLSSADGKAWVRQRFDDPAQLAIQFAIAIPISLIVSAALYSVFFKSPGTIGESYTTYLNYFDRATGLTGHEKPWNYYLELLFWKEMADGFTWSEAITLILAAIGIIAAFTWRKLPHESRVLAQILALYTIFSFAIYSLIPYKTPWSILAALHAAIILAGFGFYALLRAARFIPLQIIWIAALLAGTGYLAAQSHKASFPYKGKVPLYAMQNRNPYVYNHTTTGFISNVIKPMEKLLDANPDGTNTIIRVIHDESAWPVPWYFRNYRFDYDPNIRENENAAIILTDPSKVDELEIALGEDYTFGLANLREDRLIYFFYKQSLFDLAHPDL